MIVSELFSEDVSEADEVSEKTLLKEIEYFQQRLASVGCVSDPSVHTMRHVYLTLLEHRKGLLNRVAEDRSRSNAPIAV